MAVGDAQQHLMEVQLRSTSKTQPSSAALLFIGKVTHSSIALSYIIKLRGSVFAPGSRPQKCP